MIARRIIKVSDEFKVVILISDDGATSILVTVVVDVQDLIP